MSVVEAGLEAEYRRADVVNVQHVAAAGATTTIIAAPGAGKAIRVLGGSVTVNAAGTAQWFHTAASGGNELTGVMTLAAGAFCPLGYWELPENTLLCCQAVTGNIRGSIQYCLVDV